MRIGVWAAVVSVFSAIVIVAMLDRPPTWSLPAIAVLVIIAGTTELIAHRASRRPLVRPSPNGPQHLGLRHLGHNDEPARPDEPQRARMLLIEALGVLKEEDIAWLTHEQFEAPWKETSLTRLRQLASFDVLATGRNDLEADEIFAAFVDTMREFLRYYDEHTAPERILKTSEWRDVGWNQDEFDTLNESERQLFLERTAGLRQRAAAVGAIYGRLLDAAGVYDAVVGS